MALTGTEAVNANAKGLDLQSPAAILRLLADAQVEAARSVQAAIHEIAQAAELAAQRLATGGRLFYAAAGSSALMALADALELPGTYGISHERVVVLIAGGKEAFVDLPGAPEDDAAQAAKEVADNGMTAGDCLIALSASGTTPYALGALEEASRRGAATIGVANNAGTPLVTRANVGIVLATPPEIVAGSTRMGAGTAQKIALNMFSTLVAVHLGHVHDGYMVNLRIDNQKLRDRAARIVSSIAGCSRDDAERFLERSGGSVKTAILLAAGVRDAGAAKNLLESSGQKLRPALASLEEGSRGSRQNRT
ncbi:N-acetylmuramic acid 6-phosphate etherase [Mesorhizobium sp. LHD-90]|uniref:N-acetylmuramic acid 6-phosphate etherase n=1 Tax=Mesorhizobium sp. LHD-90 TaxID=3071414 RepID=UPI0027DEEE5A|nr:N-acetylmuramic acid 6-phosphate etherase [Mesorhizobium sp. LHD-90]MDQ6435439.1 N-acetylmuramic acid 6-phosphate etherase [Mesorhizobium sp. LHD-90]